MPKTSKNDPKNGKIDPPETTPKMAKSTPWQNFEDPKIFVILSQHWSQFFEIAKKNLGPFFFFFTLGKITPKITSKRGHAGSRSKRREVRRRAFFGFFQTCLQTPTCDATENIEGTMLATFHGVRKLVVQNMLQTHKCESTRIVLVMLQNLKTRVYTRFTMLQAKSSCTSNFLTS